MHADIIVTMQKIREVTLAYFKQDSVQNRVKAMGMEPGGAVTSDEMMTDLKQAYQEQAKLLKSIDYQPE